jgi:SAM-dependent methyltransferase
MSDPQLDGLKDKHRALWDAGDYAAVADRMIAAFGPRLVERSGVGPGEKLLDVAAGSGNVTLPLAAAGATVTALDLAPGLLATGRERAEAAGLEIDWIEGDAEDLPFDDAGFDVITSVVGVQFVPRHARASAELARVLRPGGRLWLFNWTPEGLIGQFLRAIGAQMPPPPDFASPPALWGNEDHVRELLADRDFELGFERETVTMPAESAEDFVEFMARFYGPLVKAREALSDDGRWEPLREELTAVGADLYVAGEGSSGIAAEYLIVDGRKTA